MHSLIHKVDPDGSFGVAVAMVVARSFVVLGLIPGRLGYFFIEFMHIQCSKLFKGLECAVLSMVLCTIKNL